MGCCQSDLKGEKQADVTAEAPQPMKKVATNFSTVDYDSGATNRRDTVYAPDEAEQKKRSHELPAVAENPGPSTVDESDPITDRNKSAVSPKTSRVPDPKLVEGGETQEPYKDVDGHSPTSPTQVIPPTITTTTTTAPTTAAVAPEVTSTPANAHTTADMGLFSKSKPSTNEPIMNGTEEDKKFSNSIDSADPTSAADAAETGQVKEKKSLYRKYQDLKRGSGTSALSDEELMKYTGKTREELNEWSKTAPGVAGNQRAGSLTAGGTSHIGIADGAGAGLGGWGREGSKDPVIH